MQNYKDQSGKLYALDSTEFEYLLPPGCVRITQEEADAINAAANSAIQNDKIKTQLAALDLKAVRALRAIAAGTATAADHAKVEEIETEAIALRAQLA